MPRIRRCLDVIRDDLNLPSELINNKNAHFKKLSHLALKLEGVRTSLEKDYCAGLIEITIGPLTSITVTFFNTFEITSGLDIEST